MIAQNFFFFCMNVLLLYASLSESRCNSKARYFSKILLPGLPKRPKSGSNRNFEMCLGCEIFVFFSPLIPSKCQKKHIIVNFINQKLKSKHTSLKNIQTEQN